MELGTLYYRNKDGEMVPFHGITEAKFEDCSGYSEWADEKVIDSIPAGLEFSFELKQDDMIAHWWMMWKLGILDYYNWSPVRKDNWLRNHVSVLQVGFARRLYGIFGIRAIGLYMACDPLLSIYAKARFTKGGMYQEWLTKKTRPRALGGDGNLRKARSFQYAAVHDRRSNEHASPHAHVRVHL